MVTLVGVGGHRFAAPGGRIDVVAEFVRRLGGSSGEEPDGEPNTQSKAKVHVYSRISGHTDQCVPVPNDKSFPAQ